LVRLAQTRTALKDEASAKLDELHRRANVKPSDNILEFLGNQLYGVANARAEYRQAAGRAEIVSKDIAETNSLIQQSVQTYKAIEEPITASAAEAMTRLASAEADLNVRKAQLEGFKHNTESVLRAQQLSKSALDTIFQVRTALQAEQQLKISLDHLQLSKEQFDSAKQEKKVADEARQENKQTDEYVLENINIGLAALGLPEVDAREAKFVMAQFKAGKQDLYDMYQRGRASKVIGFGIIGTSAADSIDVLNTHPEAVRNLPESRTPVLQLLATAREDVLRNPQIDKKDKKAVDSAINKSAQALLEQQAARADGSPENIFNIGDLKQYLGSAPTDARNIQPPAAIKNTPIFKKLLIEQRDAGTDLSNPKIVFEMAVAAVAANKISFEDAVSLSTVYRQAVQINLSAKGLTGFGLVAPKNGKSLNVKLGTFSGVVDITDPVALSRKLAEKLAEKLYQTERINTLLDSTGVAP
jgi:hypothetical protein